MILSIIIVIISLALDIILNNFLPYLSNDLSLFTPMFSIVSLFLIYPLIKKDVYKFLVLCFSFGIIYDLIFTNLLFLNAIIFLLIGLLIKYLYNYFEINYLNIILLTIIIICSYEMLMAFVILVFNLVPISFYKLLYKISHSLIANVMYAEIMYFIINCLPSKYKKISIN